MKKYNLKNVSNRRDINHGAGMWENVMVGSPKENFFSRTTDDPQWSRGFFRNLRAINPRKKDPLL